MKLRSFLLTLGWLGLWSLTYTPASAQISGNLKDADDPAVLTLNLDPLSPFEGENVPEPYRQLFMIFNDGQFYSADVPEAIFQQAHGFDGISLGGNTAEAIVFSKAIYSDEDGDPPPKIVSGNGPTVVAAVPDKVKAIPDTGIIAITPDHPALIPNGRTVITVSAKNPVNSVTSAAVPVDGYLLVFYESKLTVEKAERLKKKKNAIEKIVLTEQKLDVYIDQADEVESLANPLPFSFFDAVDLVETAPGNDYNTLRVIRLSALQPGEERHFFLPLLNQDIRYDSIPEGGTGSVGYAAVLLLEPGNFSFPQLTTAEVEGISKLGVAELLGQGIPLATLGDPSGTLTLDELQPAGYTEASQKVRRSYDPNAIELWSCPCPDKSLVEQKLLIKVSFENEGAGATREVRVRVPLPDGISVANLSDELFSVMPGVETIDLEKDTLSNVFTVTFPSLRLPGTDEAKSAAERTGYFSFLAYSDTGVDLNTLSPTQACISFRDENAPEGVFNAEICTPPGSITPVGQTVAKDLALALDCSICEVQQAAGTATADFPLWLFFLLLVIVVLAVLFAFYSDEWLG
ncbi:MAG: hypothetical protein KI786_11125 [Mameliella sp.]|nr:hypothetical protein [Phaeodactylibacter sp.]